MAVLNQQTKTQQDSGVEPARDGTAAGWDEPRPPGTSGGDPGTNGASWLIYVITAACVFAVTLVNAFSAAHDAVRRGGAYDLGLPLLYELSSAIFIVALLPLVDVSVRWVRGEIRWPAKLRWGAGAVLVFSAVHIVGMVGLRKLVMATVGNSYGFAFSLAELVYEFRKDAVTYLMLGAVFWLAASRRDRATEVAGAQPPPASALADALWLRDGPARIRIEPDDIVMVTSAGNYVEYCMAGGRTHLIRGTLAAEETRLSRYNIVRVHRTRLISLARVSALQAGPSGDFELTLDTGQVVSGSRRYRSALEAVVEQR